MSPRLRRALIAVAALAVIAAGIWWWLSSGPRRARVLARQAASPMQQQLWNAVDDRGLPDGVNRLQARMPTQPGLTLAPSQPIAPVNPVLAPGVDSAARLLTSTQQESDWQYRGEARIAQVTGERLRLELGNGDIVEILARVGKGAMNLAGGDRADVTFTMAPDVRDREHVIGVRSPGGDVLITAVKTGPERVVLDVTLPGTATKSPELRLTASQETTAASTEPPVLIVIDGAKDVVRSGEQRTIAGFTVRVVMSVARPDVGGDASPFGIDLVVSRIGGAP